MSQISTKFRSKFVITKDSKLSSKRSSYGNVHGVGFQGFPLNILLNIFKYFDEQELRHQIMLVCQDWKFASQQPILWKHLTIRGNNVPLYFICKQIRMYIHLESVLIDNIIEPTTVIRQICRCLPRLKHLAVRYCAPVPETAVRLIISSCPLLETLDLCGTEVRGTFAYKSMAGLHRLKKLNLGNNPHLTIKSLITAVLNCPNLEDLRISKFANKRESFNDEDALLILANLAEQLLSISLDCTSLSSSAFQTVFNCKNLERLSLSGAANLTAMQFVKIWQKCSNLKFVKIRNAHQIGEEHIKELFIGGASVMKNLAYLDFGGCFRVTDEAINAIANCCEKLEYVGLKSCKSVTTLTSLFHKNPNIKTLNIAFMYNLNIDNPLLLPVKLKKLFVDDSRLFDQWLIEFREKHVNNIKILVCQSEYNNIRQNMNFFQNIQINA